MRTNLVNFFQRFRAAGIGDAKKAARYSDDIQLVREVSEGSAGIPFDYDNLIPDPIPPVYEFMIIPGGPAGRPTVELHPGGRGLWLLATLTSNTIAANIATWTIPEPGRGLFDGPTTPTQANSSSYGNAQDSLAHIESGNFLPEDIPPLTPQRTALLAVNGGQGSFFYVNMPFFVAPGTVVTQQRIGANGSIFLGFIWRDVPVL